MKKLPWYVYVIAGLLFLYSFALYNRPRATNWTPTLSNKDKIPFGAYILYAELHNILDAKPEQLRITPYEQFGDTSLISEGEVYLCIAPVTDFSREDVGALLKFAGAGNDVFISAEYLGKSLSDTLHLGIEPDLSQDSITVNLTNPGLRPAHPFAMPRGIVNAYFGHLDTSLAVVLGTNSKGKANFIRMPVGEGQIFINTVPGMFSNYSLLEEQNSAYVSAALSYLPSSPDQLYWDEYFKQGRPGETSPLRVLLHHPQLKMALFTALAAVILFMVFQSKRRQRVIPVITPPVNTSVDFVETVSQVYFNQRNHRNIAMKQITYLFEYIRSHYHLQTAMPDEPFEKKLSHKSGMPEEKVKAMMSLIRMIRSEEKISDQHLLALHRHIEEFHKYANQ